MYHFSFSVPTQHVKLFLVLCTQTVVNTEYQQLNHIIPADQGFLVNSSRLPSTCLSLRSLSDFFSLTDVCETPLKGHRSDMTQIYQQQ